MHKWASAIVRYYHPEHLDSEKDTNHELLKGFDSPFSIDMDLYPEFE